MECYVSMQKNKEAQYYVGPQYTGPAALWSSRKSLFLKLVRHTSMNVVYDKYSLSECFQWSEKR